MHAQRTSAGRLLGAALVALSALTIAPHAEAKPPAKKTAAPTVDAKALQAKLAGGDATAIAQALAEAKQAGPGAASIAPAIEDLLRRGAPVAIAKAAMEALSAIGLPSSSAALRPYLSHRIPELRKAAVHALGDTKGPDALAAFREGLRSSDPVVRGFSASGLGNLGAAVALPDLFLALDRHVSEAAAAIGQLCAPNDCESFANKLGDVAFDVMTSGFDPILFRTKPLPEDALLKIVGRLRELGTPEAGKYLADVESRWSGSAKVKQALESAVASIPGARQGGG
jgi:HEAT repeat protein